jgi:hypothetical protein
MSSGNSSGKGCSADLGGAALQHDHRWSATSFLFSHQMETVLVNFMITNCVRSGLLGPPKVVVRVAPPLVPPSTGMVGGCRASASGPAGRGFCADCRIWAGASCTKQHWTCSGTPGGRAWAMQVTGAVRVLFEHDGELKLACRRRTTTGGGVQRCCIGGHQGGTRSVPPPAVASSQLHLLSLAPPP